MLLIVCKDPKPVTTFNYYAFSLLITTPYYAKEFATEYRMRLWTADLWFFFRCIHPEVLLKIHFSPFQLCKLECFMVCINI